MYGYDDIGVGLHNYIATLFGRYWHNTTKKSARNSSEKTAKT